MAASQATTESDKACSRPWPLSGQTRCWCFWQPVAAGTGCWLCWAVRRVEGAEAGRTGSIIAVCSCRLQMHQAQKRGCRARGGVPSFHSLPPSTSGLLHSHPSLPLHFSIYVRPSGVPTMQTTQMQLSRVCESDDEGGGERHKMGAANDEVGVLTRVPAAGWARNEACMHFCAVQDR